jgi:hypothetical protein
MEGASVVEQSVDTLERYHKYLVRNYEGGCERFFSPTGFLREFQKSVEVQCQSVRNHVFASSVDDACAKLEPAVAGREGVFDLTAEPGTGKTSVLPFRFETKKVVVALPTPFEAWNAFNMATGDCRLVVQGLDLGPAGSNVVYTDSYLAAKALLSKFLDYDIMIVDECDSDKGVSKFLSEVKAPGKLIIRMSASHGAKQAASSRAFPVTESNDMPDVRNGVGPVARFVRDNHSARSLVMAPDADTAIEISKLIPGSVLATVKSDLGTIARAMLKQEEPRLLVSDDVCGRSLNLNLDAIFDCQLVTEYANIRHLTDAELYQRRNRAGRNKPGWYYSPGLPTKVRASNDYDVTRHNVVRAIAGVPQSGSDRLRFQEDQALQYMCSPHEPYEAMSLEQARDVAVISPAPSSSSSSSRRTYHSASVLESDDEMARTSITPPKWLCYFANGGGSGSDSRLKGQIADTFVVSSARRKAHARKRSSESSEDGKSAGAVSAVVSNREWASRMAMRSRPSLPDAEGAPYAVSRRRESRVLTAAAIPMSPPLMDLTQLNYDMDWPSLVRDALMRGGDLPTLVPYGSWRHTSAGGMGTNWYRRLEDISQSDASFDESEFEVVCRAWNKLVAQSWVQKTTGLPGFTDEQRLEFCLRYFQSYFLLGSAS